MRNNKKLYRVFALLLCMLIITGLKDLSDQGKTVSPVIRVEAAVVQSTSGTTKGFSPVVNRTAGPVEHKAANRSVWDKIKEKLPKFDLSHFDKDTEKEKLREAIRKMDELGISPEKLVERIWNFVNRKENKEKIDHVVDEIRDKTGKAKDKVEKEVTDRASQVIDDAAGQAEQQIKEKAVDEISNRASQAVDETVDQLEKQVKEKVSE